MTGTPPVRAINSLEGIGKVEGAGKLPSLLGSG